VLAACAFLFFCFTHLHFSQATIAVLGIGCVTWPSKPPRYNATVTVVYTHDAFTVSLP